MLAATKAVIITYISLFHFQRRKMVPVMNGATRITVPTNVRDSTTAVKMLKNIIWRNSSCSLTQSSRGRSDLERDCRNLTLRSLCHILHQWGNRDQDMIRFDYVAVYYILKKLNIHVHTVYVPLKFAYSSQISSKPIATDFKNKLHHKSLRSRLCYIKKNVQL